ncbi:MAG TPA: hypothetical protein VFX51_06295 [Solirubrobacteraceae bacterium]|nr:hypothetical protein [Solirubrobacteraceae bacterium]
MPLRLRTIVAGAVLAGLTWAAPASARIIEVGSAPPEATPTCPSSPCLAVSRTTGYQAKVVDSRSVYIVPADGRIVAWTISLGKPNTRQIDFFDSNYGEASAGLTILRRGKRLYHRVLGQSPIEKLQPYFGQKVQFPLTTSIPVKKGYVVGLTVPTWAPALTQLLDNGSSWRASRAKGKCDDTDTQTAQTRLRQRTQYRCLYRAQLTYSATLITTPKPNKKPKN